MAKTSSQRVLVGYIVAKSSQRVWVGYIKWQNTESTCFGRLYKVAKTSSQRVLVWLYKVAKTSSHHVLVGYINWRKHRVNVFW